MRFHKAWIAPLVVVVSICAPSLLDAVCVDVMVVVGVDVGDVVLDLKMFS